jgi:hypothetical protein
LTGSAQGIDALNVELHFRNGGIRFSRNGFFQAEKDWLVEEEPTLIQDPQTVETTDRARQGVTGHGVRYVLIFGLLSVIVAFAILFVVLGR